MNTFFQENKNDIGWLGSNFKKHFGDMKVTLPKKATFTVKKLERDMLDKEILAEFKPNECTLGDMAYAMKNGLLDKEKYNANIFYIREKDNTLWAVGVVWLSDRRVWDVGAFSVSDPDGWDSGRQVFSRDSLNLRTSEPADALTLGDFEIVVKGKRYRLEEIK